MLSQFSLLKPQYIAPAVVILILSYLGGKFLFHYWAPARRLQRSIKELAEKAQFIKGLPAAQQRSKLGDVFSGTALEHSWLEFNETLHDQFEEIERERHVARIRATAPSSYFFSAQKIIETPLRTEYFKHLPGILTGIGIIGTFAGLMLGLHHFDPSDPAKVQDSVAALLNDVLCAFFGSMLSIVVAMIITHSEKENLRQCVEALEMLTDAIDRIFDAGVTEEYLADLVRHTQESSVQTRLLKDSLVTDLREMLQNLVETQVRENLKLADSLSKSYRESGDDIALKISSAIEDSLKEPLNKLATSVNTATGDQSGKVQSLLQDVLVAFMEKLEGTFGSQFNGMQDMLQQSIMSMQQMQGMFAGLVQDMRIAGESSSQTVQEQLSRTLADMHSNQTVMQAAMNEMIESLQNAVASIGIQGTQAGSRMGAQIEKIFEESEARQQAMAEHMQTFINTLKESVGEAQNDTMQRISDTVAELGVRLGDIVGTFEKNRHAMDERSNSAQEHLHRRTESIVGELSTQVKSLLDSLQLGHETTRHAIKSLGEQTDRAFIGLQQGADKINVAAEKFAIAGKDVADAATASSGLSSQLRGSATELKTASQQLSEMLQDYRAQRDALHQSIGIIESIVANAQAEGGMRGQVLMDLKSVSDRMQILNEEARSYLEQVTGVLGKSFDSFGTGVEKSLSRALGSFDAELDKAIKALGGGVQDLSDNLEIFGDMVEKSTRPHRVA